MNSMSAFIEAKKPTVTHYVQNLREAAAWYRDMLGFEIGPHEYGSFVELHMQGEYIFHLAPAREGMIPHPDPVFWFASTDIEQTYAFLQSKEVQVGPMHWFPDYSSFTFRDLDGNAVAINQNYEMRVRELDALHLIGIRVVCKEESEYVMAIPRAAHQLRERIAEINGVVDPHLLVGVYKPGETVAEEDGYWVCVRVDPIADIPDGMVAMSVPSQRYAVKWHYGLRNEVSHTYQKLHHLLDEAGHRRKPNAWNVEMQRNWGLPEESEIEMDLYCTIE
jgi:predicted transcriptional regulator YdeE